MYHATLREYLLLLAFLEFIQLFGHYTGVTFLVVLGHMIVQQQLVREAVFSGLVLAMRPAYRSSLAKYNAKDQSPITLRAEILVGSSYGSVLATLPSLQDAPHCLFPTQFAVLFGRNQKQAQLALSFHCQQSRIATSSNRFLLPQTDSHITLPIIDASSEPIGEISLSVVFQSKGHMPSICLKTIACELKNSISTPLLRRYLEIQVGKYKFRNQAVQVPLFWNTPLQFYLQGDVIKWRLVEEQGQVEQSITIAIPAQRVDGFTLREGFKRVFIIDELDMPKGCIQFYYTSVGLRSAEEYARLAELQENIQKQILCLTVKTIKCKLKIPHQNSSVRVFSGMNFIMSERVTQSSTDSLFTLQRYLYLQLRETKCNMVVCSGEEVVGVGILQLNMMGCFQRRVGVVCPRTRKELGYLMVAVQSAKHPANTIQLAQLRLHTGRLQIHSPVFLSFSLPGSYTRTEMQQPKGPTLAFRRLILMKYTNEQQLEISLTDGTQDILKTVVSIDELKRSGQTVCRKGLTLSEELGCRLEIACIYGDLNKIDLTEVLNTTPSQQPKPLPIDGVQQLQRSLGNHVRPQPSNNKKLSNLSMRSSTKRTTLKSIPHSQEKPHNYRILYTSRPHPKLQIKQEIRLELPELKTKGRKQRIQPKAEFIRKGVLVEAYSRLRESNKAGRSLWGK